MRDRVKCQAQTELEYDSIGMGLKPVRGPDRYLGHVFDTFPILKAVPPDEDFACINITQPNFKFI